MPIVSIVTFKAKDARYPDLKKLLKEMLIDTAARPGAEIISAAGDAENGTLVVYEQWDSDESLQGYRAWSSENRDPARLVALLREAPTSELLEHVF